MATTETSMTLQEVREELSALAVYRKNYEESRDKSEGIQREHFELMLGVTKYRQLKMRKLLKKLEEEEDWGI